MSIIIKLLLAACLLFRLTNCNTTNDDDSDGNISNSAEVLPLPRETFEIPPDPTNYAEENERLDREKRRSFGKLKEMLQARLISEPSLGSTLGKTATKSQSNSTSFLDAFAKTMSNSFGKGFSAFPLMSPQSNISNIKQNDKKEMSAFVGAAHEQNAKSNSSSILDTFAKTMSNSFGFSAFPLMSPQKTPQNIVDKTISNDEKELPEAVAAAHNQPIPCSGSSNTESLANEPIVGVSAPEMTLADPLNREIPSNGNDPMVGAKGPVVQPAHLMDDSNSIKPFGFSINRITPKQMKDTAALRKQINHAVRRNTYAHSSDDARDLAPNKDDDDDGDEASDSSSPSSKPYSNIYDFWEQFLGRSRSFFKTKPLFKLPTSLLGSARSDFSYVPSPTPSKVKHGDSSANVFYPAEPLSDDDSTYQATVDQMMANAAAKTKSEGITTNTVDSFMNRIEQPVYEISQARESLQMKSIVEDMRFKIGEHVIEWKTLQRNHQESHALIGLTKTSVVLVLEKNGNYSIESEIPLMAPIYFTTLTHWNQTKNAIEGIVIVATENEIVFLRINEQMTHMDAFWMWPMYRKAQYVKYMQLDNSPTLLLISNTSVSLYRFDFDQRESYMRESFQLTYPAKTASQVHSGHETFLCFPQKSYVTIYKYVNSRFKFFSRIDADNAETVTSFEMGGYSYIGIGGAKPKILRYHRGDFHDQTILAHSWGYVEHFLAVPARTYRDDLILFIQHRVTYGTHENSYLEALIWNGHAFDAALNVPCFANEVKSPVGMACMLDSEREEGILGATVFQRNRTISILVPRFDAPSGLFDLEIELQPAVYTYNEHLIELLSEVMILLETRDQVLTNAKELINSFSNVNFNEITITNQSINVLYTDDLELGETIPTNGIFYNDELITEKKAIIFTQMVQETQSLVDELDQLDSSERPKRTTANHTNNFHFTSVDVDELYAEYINDIPVNDFVFVEDGQLVLDGTVILSQPIEADNVEEIDENAFVGDSHGPKQITTHITGDLTFEVINGIKWKELVDQVFMKNLPNSIADLTINGDLAVEKSVNINKLNGLNFPAEYIQDHGREEVIVTGKKTFEGFLVTDMLDCFGTLNGVDPSRIVTLNGTQTLTGTTTFKHLEVIDALEVSPNGTISGRHLNEFLSNPTLKDTRDIHSNCLFKSIHVDGPVFIRNTLNDVNLDQLLGDVVYKHETKPICSSLKTFQSISAPNIKIRTNLLNDIPLDSYVTNNTEQTFAVNQLDADVLINRLEIDGLVNFINITELDMNSIKLSGDQFTNAELTFVGNEEFQLNASQIIVQETINGIDVNDFISIDGSFELFGDVQAETIDVQHCTVEGEIVGNAQNVTVNGFNITSLQASYLSRTKPQQFFTPVTIETAVIRGGFLTNDINGFDYMEAINILNRMESIDKIFNDSIVRVKEMTVSGNIRFDRINGFDFDYIQKNAIRLDEENLIGLPLVFHDPVILQGNLTTEIFNGVDFNDFINDLVKRDDPLIVISGNTIFRENVTIFADINTPNINDIQIDQILTRNFNGKILNPIEVFGDVTVAQLDIEGRFNNATKEHIEAYDFDVQNGVHILRKTVVIDETVTIENLQLNGGYENINNATEFISSIVRTDRPVNITGRKYFAGPIHFGNDIHISHYNDLNVQEFLSNIVLIDQTEPVVFERDVIFKGPVSAQAIRVAGDLIVKTISNCTLSDWINTSIRKDMPFFHNGTIVFHEGTFHPTNIETEYLNGMPMDKILTLNTEQHFTETIDFDVVHSFVPITTDGLVNGCDLKAEEANTLRIYGDQNISLPTVFNKIRVLGTLTTLDTVNGRDIKLAVPLTGDTKIDSPLSFQNISAARLQTNDYISGIDMDKWFLTAFQRWAPHPQTVTGFWHIKNATFDTLALADSINDMDIPSFIQQLNHSLEHNQKSLSRQCNDVQKQIDATRNTMILSNFESAFKVQFQHAVNSVYPFEYLGKKYFLFNVGCDTFLYAWKNENRTLIPLNLVTTGFVSQWIHIIDAENRLFLISNNDGTQLSENCIASGAFVWKFASAQNTLQTIAKFANAGEFRSIQIKSQNSSNFFVIRNNDNNINEFDLHGQLVGVWKTNNVKNSENATFVLREANLGLAISDNNQLRILHSSHNRAKRCGFLSKIDWQKHKAEQRERFEQKMQQMRADLESSRSAIQAILKVDTNNVTPSQLRQMRREKFVQFMQKSNEHLSTMLDLKKPDAKDEKPPTPTKTHGFDFEQVKVGASSKGKFIVDIMDKIYDWIRINENLHREDGRYQFNPYGRQNIDEESNGEQGNNEEAQINEARQNKNEPENIADSVGIEKIDEKDEKMNEIEQIEPVEGDVANEIIENPDKDLFEGIQLGGQKISESTETELPIDSSTTPIPIDAKDPQLALLGFFTLERTLAHTVNRAADALFGKDKKRRKNIFGDDEYTDTDFNLFPKLFATHDEHPTSRNARADRILQMISHAEFVTEIEQKKQEENVVGVDWMGYWMYKLEPFSDKIADDISEEIRNRRYEHRYEYDNNGDYMVGAVPDFETSTEKRLTSFWGSVKSGFRKVGRAAVNVYVFGKEKYGTAKKYFNEAEEYLYGYMDDNENDNQSYGATENYPNYPNSPNKPTKPSHNPRKKSLPSMKDFAQSFLAEMFKAFIGSDGTKHPLNIWTVIKSAAKVAFKGGNPNITDQIMADISDQSKELVDNMYNNAKEKATTKTDPSDKKEKEDPKPESDAATDIMPEIDTKKDIKPEGDKKPHMKPESHAMPAKWSEDKKPENDAKYKKIPIKPEKIDSSEPIHHEINPHGEPVEEQPKNGSAPNREMFRDEFMKSFERFAPLIDYLSDQIVDRLRERDLENDANVENKSEVAQGFTTEQEDMEGASVSTELNTEVDSTEHFLGITENEPFVTTSEPAHSPDKSTNELLNEMNVIAELLAAQIIEELIRDAECNKTENISGYKDFIHAANQSSERGESESSGVPCNETVTMFELSQQIVEFDSDTIRLGIEKQPPIDEQTAADGVQRIETTTLPIPNRSIRQNGEIVAVKVNENRKHLFIVSSLSPNNDRIQVFENVVDGKVLQTIPCSRPHSLLVFNMFRDTVLAFVQDDLEIKVYVYRGMNGFEELTSFHLQVPIKQIIHFETQPAPFECAEHYIALVLNSDIQFLRAITLGQCKIKKILTC